MISGSDSTSEPIVLKGESESFQLVSQEKVKICGITFSNNKESAYKDNILSKIDKLERQLDIWRSRNLTLQGKILIVKTFGLSQLIYSLQSTYIHNTDLKRIDSIIFGFIWNVPKSSSRSIGKIRREVMKSDFKDGGLKAPDVFCLDKAIKYKNLVRHLTSNFHPLHVIYKNLTFEASFNWDSFSVAPKSKFSFLTEAMHTHLSIGSKLYADIKLMSQENDGIHKNYYAYVQNVSLMSNRFININQVQMLTRLKVHAIETFGELHFAKKSGRFPHLFFEIHQIYNTFPQEWRLLLDKTVKKHCNLHMEISYGLNKWANASALSLKMLQNYLKIKLVVQGWMR